MCGALLSGIWWLFPLVGVALCLTFMVLAFRFGPMGRGCMSMGAPRAVARNQGGQAGPAVDAEPSH